MKKARVYLSRKPNMAVDALYRSIENSLKDSKKECILVVPDQYTVEAEQALLDFLDTSVLMRVQVKSFRSLSNDIYSMGYCEERDFLSDRAVKMLIRLILEEEDSKEEWKAFSKEVRGKGFLDLLTDQLREFREYGITPEELKEIAENLEDESYGRLKLEETASILEIYQAIIKDNFDDSDSRLKRAFACLSEINKKESYLANTDFFFEHFYSMSKTECLAMEEIMKICPTEIAMVFDRKLADALMKSDLNMLNSEISTLLDSICPDASAFSLSSHFFRQIQKTAINAGVGLEYVGLDNKEDFFSFAASSIFSYRPEKKKFENSPMLATEYRNSDRELEGLVIGINKLVIEKGAAYKDIHVIILDESEFSQALRRKFEKNSIPFFMDEHKTIHYHPLIKLIDASLLVMERGPGKDQYLKFVKSGMLGLAWEEVSAYQAYVESHKLEGSMLDSDKYFLFDEDYASILKDDKAEMLREECLNAQKVKKIIEETIKPIKEIKAGKLIDLCSDFYSFISSERIVESFHKYEQGLEKEGKREELAIHRQIWDSVIDMLDELVELAQDMKVKPRVFCRILREGLEEIRLAVIPPYQDGVFVSSLGRSRSRRRPYLFIIGMNDKNLPASKSKVGVFNDSEKDEFLKRGFYLPSMPDFAQREESFNFYLALQKVDNFLFISSSKKDANNEALSPSIWLKSLLKYTGEKLNILSDFNIKDSQYSRSLRLSELAEHIRKEKVHDKSNNKDKAEEGKMLLELLEFSKNPSDKLLIRDALLYKNDRPNLSHELCNFFFANKTRISATELEQFACCPYKSFVNRILRVEEKRTVEYDALDLGNLLHESISSWAEFINKCLKLGNLPDINESEEACSQYFFEESKRILDMHKREIPSNAFLIKMTEKTLKENHMQIFHQIKNSHLIEIKHEVSFGKNGNYPGLILPTKSFEGRPVYIEGRIDRVDRIAVNKEGIQIYGRVIDYKTGSKGFDFSRLLNGLDLQLLLYLKAVSSKDHAWGCFYMPIHPEKIVDMGDSKERKSYDSSKEDDFLGSIRLDGILTYDDEALKAGDFTIEDRQTTKSSKLYMLGSSRKIPSKDISGKLVTNEDSPKEQVRFFSEIEMQKLMEDTLNLAGKLYSDEKAGLIDPAPYRSASKQTACQFCQYKSICRFEARGQFGKYRQLDSISIEDWKGRMR